MLRSSFKITKSKKRKNFMEKKIAEKEPDIEFEETF